MRKTQAAMLLLSVVFVFICVTLLEAGNGNNLVVLATPSGSVPSYVTIAGKKYICFNSVYAGSSYSIIKTEGAKAAQFEAFAKTVVKSAKELIGQEINFKSCGELMQSIPELVNWRIDPGRNSQLQVPSGVAATPVQEESTFDLHIFATVGDPIEHTLPDRTKVWCFPIVEGAYTALNITVVPGATLGNAISSLMTQIQKGAASIFGPNGGLGRFFVMDFEEIKKALKLVIKSATAAAATAPAITEVNDEQIEEFRANLTAAIQRVEEGKTLSPEEYKELQKRYKQLLSAAATPEQRRKLDEMGSTVEFLGSRTKP